MSAIDSPRCILALTDEKGEYSHVTRAAIGDGVPVRLVTDDGRIVGPPEAPRTEEDEPPEVQSR